LSKLAGPAFLGLYNKAESLARMPNRLVTPPTSQAVFRAMSKAQDDLDQTKYMYYRTITLLMVYVSPFLVGLLWIAEPFVGVVYGKKWLPAVEPLRIIVLAGFLRNIFIPSSVVLAAQNRLTQEVAAEAVSLVIGVGACLIGLRWGLKGVAWGLVVTVALFTTHLYILVYRVLPTRIADLVKAVAPGLLLNTILLGVLIIVHLLLADLREGRPLLYLAAMVLAGSIAYASAFLLVPIPALRSETTRWKQSVRGGLALASRTLALTKSRTDRR
jgi:O-antigen/teichoic acid export membrane protein